MEITKSLYVTDAKQWRSWLAKNHKISNEIWLIYYKKDSGKKRIAYSEALDEALCFGWIDGQAQARDTLSWAQRFTPRRAKSLWSQRNTQHAARLINEGKMTASGLDEIKKAKKDGRWGAAYPSPRVAEAPADFLKLLSKHKNALAFFHDLNKVNQYAIHYRLHTAKKPETRERRMKMIVDMMKNGKKFH